MSNENLPETMLPGGNDAHQVTTSPEEMVTISKEDAARLAHLVFISHRDIKNNPVREEMLLLAAKIGFRY